MVAALSSAEKAFLGELTRRFPDKLSRLRGGFYDIKNKQGLKVPFRMNAHQEQFLISRHGMDLVLKARQLGYTTVIQIDMLDDCLFTSNLSAGVIAHNLVDAKAFFRDKIKFAYDNLPEPFRKVRAAENDSAESLRFNNGSSVRVGVSLRSGTLQRLHVSEYGKLCAKYPDRAVEVKTGAFNTVAVGQNITVESTAEGRAGEFHDMVAKARKLDDESRELTALDFKFHFTAWWEDAGNVLDADVIETAEVQEYFEKLQQHPWLAKRGVIFTREQRAWYIKKAEQQGDKMKQEHPSHPDEAFEASVEGAYFGPQMLKLRQEGRICRIPVLDIPVYTTWDLGVNDSTAICFWQDVGMERRLIDYYENTGEGFGHYAKILKDRGYNYSRHYMPHDAEHRMMGIKAKSKKEHALEAGIGPIDVLPRIMAESDGIAASRAFLPSVWIDETRCDRIISCLDMYRKAWDERNVVFRDTAVHDEHSHGYKAFESAAIRKPPAPERPPTAPIPPMASAFAKR